MHLLTFMYEKMMFIKYWVLVDSRHKRYHLFCCTLNCIHSLCSLFDVNLIYAHYFESHCDNDKRYRHDLMN